MAVISSAVGRVKPGRYEDFVSQALEASKLYERLGAETPRLFSAGVAGEAFGTWTFSTEFPTMEAYGTFSDALLADAEWQSFTMRLQDENSPSTIENVNTAVELPGRTSRGGRGPVNVVNVSRVNPGGLERSIELGVRACDFVEGQGALNARSFDLVAAGMGAGMQMSIWEFENMRALGACMDAWGSDPAGRAIAVDAAAADAPLTRVFEGVYTQIPI